MYRSFLFRRGLGFGDRWSVISMPCECYDAALVETSRLCRSYNAIDGILDRLNKFGRGQLGKVYVFIATADLRREHTKKQGARFDPSDLRKLPWIEKFKAVIWKQTRQLGAHARPVGVSSTSVTTTPNEYIKASTRFPDLASDTRFPPRLRQQLPPQREDRYRGLRGREPRPGSSAKPGPPLRRLCR
jgi:hypothetical protein